MNQSETGTLRSEKDVWKAVLLQNSYSNDNTKGMHPIIVLGGRLHSALETRKAEEQPYQDTSQSHYPLHLLQSPPTPSPTFPSLPPYT